MDLFTYLMAKNGQNTGGDLFSYLLGKGNGESGTYTTFSGITLNISNTVFGKIKNFMLNSTELTQDGTPSPDTPVDVNVIKGDNNVKVENKNLAPSNWGENFVSRINDSSLASITTQDNRNCVTYTANAGYGDYDNKYLFKTNWKENTQYTISYFAYSSTGYINLAIEYTDGTSTSMDGTPITNWSKITLTSTANKTIKYIRGRYTGGITYIDLDTFQVEEGIIATEYIEHQEQNYPISLSSKNLFDKDTAIYKNGYYRNNSGEEVSTTISGYTTSFMSVKPNTTYTISGKIRTINKNGAIYCYDVSKNWIERQGWTGEDTTSFTFTTPNNCYYIQFQYTMEIFDTTTVQLEVGSTATTYEPYYNIEYCKIGDYADQISNQFESKNLLNIANYNGTINNLNIKSENQQIAINGTANSGTYTWIVITKDNFFVRNGTPSATTIVDYAEGKIISIGIVSKLKEVISGTSTVDFGINLYDENGTVVSTPTETTNIIALGMYLGNGQTFNNYNFGIQLEEGDIATEYIPYGITKGEWYLKKNIGKVVLDDSKITKASTSYTNVSYARISKPDNFIGYGNYTYYNVLCNKGVSANADLFGGFNSLNMIGKITSQAASLSFWVGFGVDTTEEAMKTQLNNATIYYGLATSQYIHISQEEYPTLKAQLDNLYNNAKSYNGQTNITQTNDDLPFNISADVKVKEEVQNG